MCFLFSALSATLREKVQIMASVEINFVERMKDGITRIINGLRNRCARRKSNVFAQRRRGRREIESHWKPGDSVIKFQMALARIKIKLESEWPAIKSCRLNFCARIGIFESRRGYEKISILSEYSHAGRSLHN